MYLLACEYLQRLFFVQWCLALEIRQRFECAFGCTSSFLQENLIHFNEMQGKAFHDADYSGQVLCTVYCICIWFIYHLLCVFPCNLILHQVGKSDINKACLCTFYWHMYIMYINLFIHGLRLYSFDGRMTQNGPKGDSRVLKISQLNTQLHYPTIKEPINQDVQHDCRVFIGEQFQIKYDGQQFIKIYLEKNLVIV